MFAAGIRGAVSHRIVDSYPAVERHLGRPGRGRAANDNAAPAASRTRLRVTLSGALLGTLALIAILAGSWPLG
ncbi:hypothetical protein [Methylobacterium oxalidis]|uniref:Uncharacterized protein n=1 Tax=Methylobacterium oxalidis TaxID=944322 RepID=A0A512IZR9_9HYPH|nr:hypothetical protein [Methylobacterium oxalidis]GEP03143.1 hypothetical protein MOX02_11810 [Methylobacterium oxalidis]GJE31478.1 hypothetical protein LDDCCGHA_1657 [Methylobacterium oxalidis]GLS67402.1 hypothetical protein GCM10007888_57860 [Methylobacterium oxalidis]